jgi:broad specificity phosphatase PhoE
MPVVGKTYAANPAHAAHLDSSKHGAVLLVRHFATPANERGISRGWSDVGIDRKEAHGDAERVAAVLKAHGVGELLTSDLRRARESAELIAEKMGGEVRVTPKRELRTWKTGMDGKPEADTRSKRQYLASHPDRKPPGGENFNSVRNRYSAELSPLLDRARDGENVAAVIHGHQAMMTRAVLEKRGIRRTDWDKMPEPGSVMKLHPHVGGVDVSMAYSSDETEKR